MSTTRATLPELLDFANKVREAGGGNPLDALMPAVPEDPSRCLIAKNLNFNCIVNSAPCEILADDGEPVGADSWIMAVESKETRDRIASALNLRTVSNTYLAEGEVDGDWVDYDYAVVLPAEIAQVAADFDVRTRAAEYDGTPIRDFDPELAALVAESEREARGLASIVNEDGSIVL